MKLILKPIFELLTGDFALFGNVLYNYIAMGIIGVIAFGVAWNIVGDLYALDIIDGLGIGSILHWIVTLISFVVIFYVFSFVLWLVKFIIAIPWWGWLITAASVVVIVIAVALIKRKAVKQNES